VVPAHDPANTKTQHSAGRAVDTLHHHTSRRVKKSVSDVWRGWCQSTAFSFAIASTCDGSPVVTWRGSATGDGERTFMAGVGPSVSQSSNRFEDTS
jgi:hypothetical protein